MPDADPQSADVLAAIGEHEGIGDPHGRRLDVLILAEGAIHPGERRLVDADGRLTLGVPERDHVGDAEPEAVPIGEAVGGIVTEARLAHPARRRRGSHAEIVLAHADRIHTGDAAQQLALRDELRMIVRGAEASMQADLVTAVAHGAHDPAGERAVGAVGEIAGAQSGEGRPAAEHEPRRTDAVTGLDGEQLADGRPDDGSRHRSQCRGRDASSAHHLAVACELGEAQERERGPPIHDVEVVRQRGRPAMSARARDR